MKFSTLLALTALVAETHAITFKKAMPDPIVIDVPVESDKPPTEAQKKEAAEKEAREAKAVEALEKDAEETPIPVVKELQEKKKKTPEQLKAEEEAAIKKVVDQKIDEREAAIDAHVERHKEWKLENLRLKMDLNKTVEAEMAKIKKEKEDYDKPWKDARDKFEGQAQSPEDWAASMPEHHFLPFDREHGVQYKKDVRSAAVKLDAATGGNPDPEAVAAVEAAEQAAQPKDAAPEKAAVQLGAHHRHHKRHH